MSHAGNIKGRGARGTYIGQAPTRPSEGGPPGQAKKAGRGLEVPRGEDKTRLGRMPVETERPRTETRTDTAFEMPAVPHDGLEGEKTRVGRPRDDKGGVFESPRESREGQRSTGERPQLPARRTAELPRQGEAPRLKEGAVQVPVQTPAPEVHVEAEPRPLEDLLPTFSESIGQEALAHHFGEELRFLGAELRPSRMAPSERAERLWSFFLVYAQANAKDPSGQTEAGRERFHQLLTEHGFAHLRDAHSGRDGVEVARWLLEARSPQELQARLAELHMEPGPQMLPSEVSIPVEQPHTPLPDPLTDSPSAAFDAAESPHLVPLKAGGAQQGVGMLGMVPADLRSADGSEVPNPDDIPVAGHARRGSNRRLGSRMFWNFLHRFRDSPEFSAVEREKWNQIAFGAILALVGATLLMVMLASL